MYGVNSNNRLKVRISLDGTTMTYDLLPGKVSYFPLQLGNGEYTFKIYQEINNSGKYTTVHSEKINVYIPDELMIYKASIVNIYWTPEMAAIVFAYDRTSATKYEWDMVREIYQYIVERYRYDYEKLAKIQNLDPGYIPNVVIVFKDLKLICYDYSVLFASMLRSLDIPARMVTGYAAGMDGYHSWNEVYNLDTGRWVVMDLTHDAAFFEWGKTYEMEKDLPQA
ncbi:MAG: transglutaminase-like domain-containing protein [Clostridia bacterium]